MSNCWYCSYRNLPGTLFCEECGRDLREKAPSTLPIEQNLPRGGFYAPTREISREYCGAETTILIYIQDQDEPIALSNFDRLGVGRRDNGGKHQPELDLTPYGALQKGVSRHHAEFVRSGDRLYIVDLNSVNGIGLNGRQLPPGEPCLVRDGDQIMLGNLVMMIYFT